MGINDETLREVYRARLVYTPTLTKVNCRNCGTRLKVYYAEEAIYAVKCVFCETVTLVEANNPTQAMRFVGEYDEKGE
jgi:ribosomal protein S27E